VSGGFCVPLLWGLRAHHIVVFGTPLHLGFPKHAPPSAARLEEARRRGKEQAKLRREKQVGAAGCRFTEGRAGRGVGASSWRCGGRAASHTFLNPQVAPCRQIPNP
jgi:hypothetical protein